MSNNVSLPERVITNIFQKIDNNKDDIIDFLAKLIKYRTPSQDPKDAYYQPEIKKCFSFLEETLTYMGFKTDMWNTKPMSFSEHPVLFGTLKGIGNGKSLAFNGHADVVPVGDPNKWHHDPWKGEVIDGKIWGRGACDMKGGVTAMVYAVNIINDCGYKLRGDVFFHIVSDEEVVGFGSRECAMREPSPDFLIVTEPTTLDLYPVVGGVEHFRIEIEGKEEHAGKRYATIYPQSEDTAYGVNAIEKGVKIVKALQELEYNWALTKKHPLFPPGFKNILPGIFIAGPGGGKDGQLNIISNPATTPNYCSIEYNTFYYPNETAKEIKQEIENYLLDICKYDPWLKDHPPKITWSIRDVSLPTFSTDADHKAITLLKDTLHYLGHKPKIKGPTYVCDISWYASKKIPGVLFGPGEITHAHSPDEFLDIAELLESIKTLALFLLEWCGFEE
jgi:acetylornithine deacetylase/succinyl-diaminopimelate desuccinylase family protein